MHILSPVQQAVAFHTISHTVGPCCCSMLLPHVLFQYLPQRALFRADIVVLTANTVFFQANTVVFFSKYNGILCQYGGIWGKEMVFGRDRNKFFLGKYSGMSYKYCVILS
jgi:hypothetical protein